MRDRRNTNLSISSTSSSTSSTGVESPSLPPSNTDKRRFLWITPGNSDEQPLPSPLLKYERDSKQPMLGLWHIRIGVKQMSVLAVVVLVYLCFQSAVNRWAPRRLPPLLLSQQNDLIGGGVLPDHPTPLIYEDGNGRQRWTVSIPETFSFPLQRNQYRDICRSGEELSKKVDATFKHSRVMAHARLYRRGGSYYTKDPGFVDVAEAEHAGVLPSSAGQHIISAVGRDDGLEGRKSGVRRVCKKTLTFVMETEDAGFAKSLLALWLAYGLAKKEGRAFFLDDTRWPYGKYTSFFPAPPLPSCSPPPPSHVLPCPHQAIHLVVSSATLPWTLNEAFYDHFEDEGKSGLRKQRQIFNLLRAGYEDLFQLIKDDSEYCAQRTSIVSAPGGPLVGMHIRRGDRRPFEYQFGSDYLPLERFVQAAETLITSHTTKNTTTHPPTLLLASDDPDTIVHPGLVSSLPPNVALTPAQDRIVLASKRMLEPAVPQRLPGTAYTKHVDENSGWEGGFFTALFYSLGKPRGSATGPDEEVPEQGMSLRTLIARAYLLDLVVLAESDAVVCAVSSAGCRVLAVMLGWDRVVRGDWVNVDDARSWSWDGYR